MKQVLLVFGGKSYEHDVSVVTAFQILQNVKISNVTLVPLYVSRENKLFLYTAKEFEISDFSAKKFSGKSKNFKPVEFVYGEKKKLFIRSICGLKEYMSADVAIFACHGGMGENGELVSLFHQMGIATSAGGVDGLAVCMNKFLFKQVMKGLKIPVVKGFKVVKSEYLSEEYKRIVELKLRLLSFPVIVKVNGGGSSIGVFVANSYDEFKEVVSQAFEFDDEVLVERFISGAREFNVAVLGNANKFEVSEIDEPLKNNELLSFADKYLSGGKDGVKAKGCKGSMVGIKKKFPADISPVTIEKIKGYAGKIFKELNLCGVVRIDFLYDEKTDKLFVCEANAIPGSLAYYFFNRGRVLINDYVLKLIEIAESQFEKEGNFNKEFATDILG